MRNLPLGPGNCTHCRRLRRDEIAEESPKPQEVVFNENNKGEMWNWNIYGDILERNAINSDPNSRVKLRLMHDADQCDRLRGKP